MNFDNSPSLRLARHALIVAALRRLGFLDAHQLEYIRFAQNQSIRWADATKAIPLPNGSVDVVYSSHMLEHLDRAEAQSFLAEAKRVLCAGGIIRIAVPDLALFVRDYRQECDADALVGKLYLSQPKPRSVKEKLARLLVGDRHHHWMYDALSLRRLLESCGFTKAVERVAGQTTIPNPASLDLYERADQSVFVEAVRP